MTHHDTQYLDLVRYVLQTGVRKTNRTGVDTLSVFGPQMRFNLRDGTIPLLTTKKMFTRGVIREILWYLMGDGNISYLKQHNVTIWDEWADKSGNLGPVYGVMWRNWPDYVWNEQANAYEVQHVDQISALMHSLRFNPDDRRMLVTAWNPALLPNGKLSFDDNVAAGKQALPPCHYAFQCFTRPLSLAERAKMFLERTNTNPNDLVEYNEEHHELFDQATIPRRELSMILNQRSCDVGLGVPFNIVQYSILLRMFAEVVNMTPGDFIWNGGDVHVYDNHIDPLMEQLRREPYESPTLRFARDVFNIDDFTFDDFVIEGYVSHPTIKMDVAV